MIPKAQEVLFRLWADGTNFVLDCDKQPKAEFARLAMARGWIGGDENWREHWEACFGEKYLYRSRGRCLQSSLAIGVVKCAKRSVTDKGFRQGDHRHKEHVGI